MKPSTTLALGLALAAPLPAARALAQPCASEQAEAGVPIRAPLGPSDFGLLPEACGASEVTLGGRLGLLIAKDDYYGLVQAGGALRGRLLLPGGSWLSASLPGFDYRYAANATVTVGRADLSASTLGWHLPLAPLPWFQIAPYVRVLLPTETVLQHATRYGFEHGISVVANLSPYFELLGGYAVPLLLTTSGAATLPLLMPTVSVDRGVRPWDWFDLVAGVSLRVVPGDAEPLEGFDPRVGLRFYPWQGMLADLSGTFPLFGRDRTLAGVGLTLGYAIDRP